MPPVVHDMNEPETKQPGRRLQKEHVTVLGVCALILFGPLFLPNLTSYELGLAESERCIQAVCLLGVARVVGSLAVGEKRFAWWLYTPIIGLSPVWVRYWLVPFLIWRWPY